MRLLLFEVQVDERRIKSMGAYAVVLSSRNSQTGVETKASSGKANRKGTVAAGCLPSKRKES